MTGLILPADRLMTPEEIRGFRYACGCFATWGRQLGKEYVSLAAPHPAPPLAHDMRRLSQRMIFMAEALDRTLGRHG